MHDVCAGYIVNDWGDVKLDKFVDDPMTASNVRRPRAVGAANKKVCFINTAVDYNGPITIAIRARFEHDSTTIRLRFGYNQGHS